jgi:hypothetical protein
MGPLRLLLLVALAAYVLGRSRTRGPGGLALVGVTAGFIVLLEASGWEWSLAAEALAYGVAGGIVVWEPSWLRARSEFAQSYEAVDREVSQELARAEQDWRTGQLDDEGYSRAFDMSNARYRALRPPPGEWSEIVGERIRIREAWSRIFADPANSTQSDRDALGVAEASLRKRISRAR